VNEHLARLRSIISDIGPLAVALSGGVDSMTLAVVAHQVDKRSASTIRPVGDET